MAIRTQEYKFFSKRIHKVAHKNRFPLRVMFELTYRCNFKCIHCYNTDEQKEALPKDELKTEEVFKILNQLKDIGCFYLGFTGGEIFLRKDILDILWYAKTKGFKVAFLTNASFIDEKMADELKRLMLDKVDITVHALNKDIFEKITQTPNSYKKVVRAIKFLHERGIPIVIKSCGMQQNKDQIVSISRFTRSLNAIYRFAGELKPRQDRSISPLQHSISPEEVYSLSRQCRSEMLSEFDRYSLPCREIRPKRRNLNRIFNCVAGYTDVTISPFGELKICILIDYLKYKILEGSLKEGWRQIKDFVDNFTIPKGWACRTCELIRHCFWCPAKSWLESGNFLSCAPSSRKQAEFLKQLYG